MIIVCGTETSATIRWSPNAVPLPCFAECRWVGAMDMRTETNDPWRQFKLKKIRQWEEECSWVKRGAASLRTRSSQMFVSNTIVEIGMKIDKDVQFTLSNQMRIGVHP